KVTTLEFFQHHFAKSGHGDGLLMTRQPTSTVRQPPLHYLTRSVRRTSGFVLADHPGVIGRWLESKCPVRPLLRFALYAAIESCFIISLPTSHGVCMRTRAIVIFLLAAWCWRAPLAAQATDSSAEAALRAAMAE